MKKQYSIILSIIILAIVIIVVNYYQPIKEEVHLEYYKAAKFETYQGIISNKYFENKSENRPTIEVKNKYGVQKVYYILDQSGLFDYIKIGDSISKNYGEYEIFVYRNQNIKTFVLDYNIP